MENKTKYNNVILSGYFWIYMRIEEGTLAKRANRMLTATDEQIMFN